MLFLLGFLLFSWMSYNSYVHFYGHRKRHKFDVGLSWIRVIKTLCRSKVWQVFYFLVLVISPLKWIHATSITGEISRVGDSTHLELKGLNQWNYELKKVSPTEYKLQVPALDEITMAALNTWSDNFILETQVDKDGPNGTYVITFKVKDPQIESFDYLTDDPSRLIVDFYVRPHHDQAKSISDVNNKNNLKNRNIRQDLQPGMAKKKINIDKNGYAKMGSGSRKNRSPANDVPIEVQNSQNEKDEKLEISKGGAFDAADKNFDRFRIKDYEINEESVIASYKNIYIRFPMLKLPVSQIPEMLENLPEFVIQPKSEGEQENKEARFLLSLYHKQIHKTDRTKDRIGAFLKVYDHFIKTFPNSSYEEIIKNLAAHIYYLRWKESQDPKDAAASQTLYRYLLSKYPDSPLAERLQLWLAYSELERGDGLGMLQEFQEYLRRYPQSHQIDQIKKAMAEGYLSLNKFDDAQALYQDLAVSAQTPQSRQEASFREGDVFFSQQNWVMAANLYQKALTTFPQMAKIFPNAYFNMGEALFWQRKYQESLNAYINFLIDFPDHPHGGYAMTRIGELLEAMGADHNRVVGVFLESYYRYQKNPGAEVGRIRMLSQQMRGMKEKELKKAMEEMTDIASRSPLPTIGEFVVLMKVDGFQRRGDHDQALKDLITYYQNNPTSRNLDLFRSRILKNLAQKINLQVQEGQFLEALKTQAKNAKTWLNHIDRLDIPYEMGQAYEQAGAYSEAQKIYRSVYEQRKSLVGQSEEKERKVNELLPSLDSLQLRRASVAVQMRDFPEAFQLLKSLNSQSQLENSEDSERIRLLADVYQEREQYRQAIEVLQNFINKWKGDEREITPNRLQLANLYIKVKDFSSSEKVAQYVLDLKKNANVVSEDLYAKALELKAVALQGQGKNLAAVETYQELLDGFESVRPLGSIRFKVGEILFQKGDLAGAEKVWKQLDEKKNETLRRLAEERLANARWQNEHRKYIKRIPAMAHFAEK